MKILEPQFGDYFVGREDEIKELKQKITENPVVVLKGDRGIGKTNLMHVVMEDLKIEGKKCEFINGSLFIEQMKQIFKPSKLSKISGISASLVAGAGISWTQDEPFILESMEKSKEKFVFIENAHELDKKASELIVEATNRNNKLRFILEIALPYIKNIELKAGSYRLFGIEKLDFNSTNRIVKDLYPDFSDETVNTISHISMGYPYITRTLAYICSNKNTEKNIHAFLHTIMDEKISLEDDEKYLLNQIHDEVLNTLENDRQEVIKKIAIAPPVLTLNLITAFCGKGIDSALNDIIERGFLRHEKKSYWIYHPLFRDYLIDIQRVAKENKKKIYYEATENAKLDFGVIYILFESLEEPDFFKDLIGIVENFNALNYIGIQCHTWGKLDQTILAWSRILKMSKDKEWESIAIGNMGVVYLTKGELGKAIEYFEKALKINEKLRRKEGIANAYGNMGIVYKKKGELDKAIEYYENALKIEKELERKEGIANAYGNMGVVYQVKGELDKAIEYYENALKIEKELGRKEGKATAYGNMGTVYGKNGELDKAIEYFENALKIFRNIGMRLEEAQTLVNIGLLYQSKKNNERALDCFLDAQELAIDHPQLFNEISIMVSQLLETN